MLAELIALFLLGGMPTTNEGSVVVEGEPPAPPPATIQRAPKMKANPTIIFPCPNAPPGYQCG